MGDRAGTANLFAFEPSLKGGFSAVVGDVNGDGVPNVVSEPAYAAIPA